jgi:hypothetical protein
MQTQNDANNVTPDETLKTEDILNSDSDYNAFIVEGIGDTDIITITKPPTPQCKFSIKRMLIPVIAIPGLIGINHFQTFLYVPIFVFLSAIILFWNFPNIILFNNRKPVYYDELFLDIKKSPQLDIEENIKNKYKTRFLWMLIISNALLLAGLSDYWLYRKRESTSYIEMIGITGGVLKLFQYINSTTGTMLLHFSRKKIKDISDEKTIDQLQNEISKEKLADRSNTIIMINPVYDMQNDDEE